MKYRLRETVLAFYVIGQWNGHDIYVTDNKDEAAVYPEERIDSLLKEINAVPNGYQWEKELVEN